MAHRSIVVVDDFYDDPEEIRRIALSNTFQRQGQPTYPGGQAIADHDWSEARQRLRTHIDEAVDEPCPKPSGYSQGLFRLALAEDEKSRIDGIHQDAQRWSAVIYLARPEDCEGGVTFFEHRETGATSGTPEFMEHVFGHLVGRPQEEIQQEILRYLADLSHWREIQRITMRYNRAVLLMGHCFHMSEGVFGTTPATGRLTQHFEFYAPGDGDVYE